MFILNGLVSILHHKYHYGNKRFDLAYITTRVIASAEPSADRFVQQYRTKVKDLEDFLCDRHGKHWHVWNLQEDSELSYNPSNFGEPNISGSKVSRYPTRDHSPMPFYKLIELVRDIQTYLGQDIENVALVHCKCGKGRTGMVVSAYLMAAHGDTDMEANREFTRKRIRYSVVRGVSINSQLRYLRYVNDFFRSGQSPEYLRQGSVRIVAVSIRYPQFKNFVFSMSALDSSLPECVQSWNMKTRRDYLTVMSPADDQAILPVDIICEFTGLDKTGSTGPVTFSFNAGLEARSANNTEDQQPFLPISFTPPPYGPQCLSLSTMNRGIHKFRCDWELVDGLYGTPWLGPRLFDSIEIFWKDENDLYH